VIPNQVRWIGLRFLDPVGRVFEYEGECYRAIYPESVAFVRELFERRIVQPLMDEGLLVQTEVSQLQLEGFGLVLRHRTAPFFLPYYAWGRLQLRDAARIFLQLNLRLLKHGLGLRDAHGANIGQFDCCRPAWIDFGSIGRLGDGSGGTLPSDAGLGEYTLRFENPLRLMAADARLARLARAIMQAGGVDDGELEALTSAGMISTLSGAHRRSIAAFGRRWLRRKLGGLRTRVRIAAPRSERATEFGKNRETLLRLALNRVPSSFPASGTVWGKYHNRDLLPSSYDDAEARARAVRSVLEKIRPVKVIDLGANAGYFSFMAARGGSHVLAGDSDEQAVDRLYAAAVDRGGSLSVTAGCFDILQPPEVRHPTVVRTHRGDLVLALALTHHLSLGQRFPFWHVVRTFARYTDDALLTEFMPNGLGVHQPRPVPLPPWYRLDALIGELTRAFQSVEVVDYRLEPDRSPRTLLLCRTPLACDESV
jgi:hypothetical protein